MAAASLKEFVIIFAFICAKNGAIQYVVVPPSTNTTESVSINEAAFSAIICFSLALPGIFFILHTYLDNPSFFFLFRIFFLFMSCLCGLLVGGQFPLANKIYRNEDTNVSRTAAYLYASDLVGGWLGGIAGAVVLLPVLGLTGTCLTVALLKLTSFLVMTTLHGHCLNSIHEKP